WGAPTSWRRPSRSWRRSGPAILPAPCCRWTVDSRDPFSDTSRILHPASRVFMQAIVKERRAPGLKVATVPKPSPGPADVLIAVRHAGVCGTDVHIADWDAWAESRIRPPVVVGGCGPIGCFAVGIARAAGAAKVIASDVNATRLALARRMGAHVTIDAGRDDVVQAVLAETGGEGADVVCEMSGVPSALHQAFAAVRLGGRVQLLGIPKGQVPIDFATEIIFKGITVYGVIGRKMYDTWHQMRRYLNAGLLDPRPVITHQFPLAKIDEALAAIRSGDAGKIILELP